MNSSDPKLNGSTSTARKERLSPKEILGFSLVLAAFAAVIVLMSSRSWVLTLIFAGIAFVSSVVLAVLVGLGKEPVSEVQNGDTQAGGNEMSTGA